MSAHALLSPSAAHRRLNCSRAPRLEVQLPNNISQDAQIGTLAHSVCEATAKKYFNKIKPAAYTRAINKHKTSPLWDDEMLRTAEIYTEHLAERAMQFKDEPYIAFEVAVDINDYVPEGFGRCDCIMFGNDTLVITDYKNGKGVKVDATKNPQLMLYALGALKLYRPIYGVAIKNIEINIDQPRIDAYERWNCSTDDLLAWGNEIKPKAQMAYAGFGEFNPGEWCRFCRANGICKSQANAQLSAFDDFKSSGVIKEIDALTPEEIGDALERGKTLIAWYESLQKVALDKLLNGTKIPGYKVVEGRSSRSWSDQDKALETLESNGIERAIIYDTVPKSLAQLEKVLGKSKFTELVGNYVIKPQGKPTLAPENDKRIEFNSAVADFTNAINQIEE